MRPPLSEHGAAVGAPTHHCSLGFPDSVIGHEGVLSKDIVFRSPILVSDAWGHGYDELGATGNGVGIVWSLVSVCRWLLES